MPVSTVRVRVPRVIRPTRPTRPAAQWRVRGGQASNQEDVARWLSPRLPDAIRAFCGVLPPTFEATAVLLVLHSR